MIPGIFDCKEQLRLNSNTLLAAIVDRRLYPAKNDYESLSMCVVTRLGAGIIENNKFAGG
ncbi:MAG: hypothetical protein ABRQ31_11190 [Smithellaceae bacterium]|jgi:hypothetical protein